MLLSRPFSTYPQVFSPQNNPTDCSWVCPPHTFLQVTLSHLSQHALHQHFSLSGCWCEASEQSVSADVMPQDRTLKAGPFPQKAHVCEVCGPTLRDSLHLAEQQETAQAEADMCRACGNRVHLTANLLSAARAACWRETLQKQHQQSLVFEELQIPSVRELFYLSGGREGPPGQLRTSSAAGPSHQGEAKQQSRVCGGLPHCKKSLTRARESLEPQTQTCSAPGSPHEGKILHVQ